MGTALRGAILTLRRLFHSKTRPAAGPAANICIGGLALILGLLLAAGAALADVPGDEFSHLKEDFEARAKDDQIPARLTLLGLETTARAWALAAARLTEDPEARAHWRRQARQLAEENPAAVPADQERRQSAALELYYHAFREVALCLVADSEQEHLALELRRIHRLTRDKLALLTDQPQLELEKRVILSGGLVSLVTVAIRSLGGNLLSPQVEIIVRELVDRAEAVSRRSDLHYRAKLQLLYINNLRRLTSLVFLLGRQAGPPLSREMARLHGHLNLYGPERALPGAQSLIWAAQAQAAIPLAYWLSHREAGSPPAENGPPQPPPAVAPADPPDEKNPGPAAWKPLGSFHRNPHINQP